LVKMVHINFEEQSVLADANMTLSPRLEMAQKHDVLETSTAASGSDSESSSVVERTECQQAMQGQVQAVLQRLTEHRKQICKLQAMVSELRTDSCTDSHSLDEALKFLQQSQKQARNYGEDLLEDMMSLDKLSGLFPEDRAGRKSAIGSLETLLDDIDAIKANIVKLQKSLEAKQEQCQHKSEQDSRPGLLAPKEPIAPEIPAPAHAVWKAPNCPRVSIHFESKESLTHYTIAAAVSNLDSNDIELSLSPDGSALIVTGVRLPTDLEMRRMQDHLREHLQTTGHDLTDTRNISHVATQAYARMGQGRYGKFSESFRLPHSVDVERISASYNEGVLSISLPKRKRLHQAMPGNPWNRPMARHFSPLW
jgi:HSP20 family molecular chaperone IbpA